MCIDKGVHICICICICTPGTPFQVPVHKSSCGISNQTADNQQSSRTHSGTCRSCATPLRCRQSSSSYTVISCILYLLSLSFVSCLLCPVLCVSCILYPVSLVSVSPLSSLVSCALSLVSCLFLSSLLSRLSSLVSPLSSLVSCALSLLSVSCLFLCSFTCLPCSV
jgi:hypothetical protein